MAIKDIRATVNFQPAQFAGSELQDFGRQLGIVLEVENATYSVLLSRHEAQKLFDEMWWAYYFRPTENP